MKTQLTYFARTTYFVDNCVQCAYTLRVRHFSCQSGASTINHVEDLSTHGNKH